MALAGGHSNARKPTEEEVTFLTSPQVHQLLVGELNKENEEHGENESNRSDVKFEPILLTTQVVAGTNYQVKYKMVVEDSGTTGSSNATKNDDDKKYIHAKIFQPLPCYADEQGPGISSFTKNKSLEDAL